MDKIQLDRVPAGLRIPLDSYRSWLPQFIERHAETDSMTDLLTYISGAMKHQSQLAEERANGVGTVSYVAKLLSVRMIERKTGSGYVLGRKAEMTFEAISGKRKGEEEKGTTSWTSGGDSSTTAFEIALSRSVLDFARANIGADLRVTKHTFQDDEGDKHKTIINLEVVKPAPSKKRDETPAADPETDTAASETPAAAQDDDQWDGYEDEPQDEHRRGDDPSGNLQDF